MEVVVTGIGIVSALGKSQRQTWDNLLSGHSGLRWCSPFPEYQKVLLGMVGNMPQTLDNLVLESLDDALADAHLSHVPASTGIVIGSSRGNQLGFEALARRDMPLEDWLSIFQTSPGAIAARRLKTTGPVFAPRAACATGLWAIAQGADLIRQGLAEVVIAGGVEASITPLTIAGFQKMGALSEHRAAPFDRDRSGFILGEGAAILVLESSQHAQKRQHAAYGSVLGFGSSADAYHISAPHPNAQSAIQAVQRCLQLSHLAGTDIEFVHTHGTGTQLNDVNESQIIQSLCPQRPPCTSSKGAIGHTLGASGALGSAFCLLGIAHQVLSPCTGFQQSDPACDLQVVQASKHLELQNSLCLSFGFGGQNAAIAFSRIKD